MGTGGYGRAPVKSNLRRRGEQGRKFNVERLMKEDRKETGLVVAEVGEVTPTEPAKESKKTTVDLPKNIIDAISAVAAKKGIEAYQKHVAEGVKRRKDKRLHNARLLLKKYKWLSDYGENAVGEVGALLTDEDVQLLETFGISTEEVRQVSSIRSSIVRTQAILKHVDMMLDLYKTRCLTSGKQELERRWRVLEAMYLAKETKSAIDISEQEYITERTVFRDVDRACEELTTLFFGLDLENILTV